MITVANRAETAGRIRFAFERGRMMIPELCDRERLLPIDSKVLAKAEAKASADEEAGRGEAANDDGEDRDEELATFPGPPPSTSRFDPPAPEFGAACCKSRPQRASRIANPVRNSREFAADRRVKLALYNFAKQQPDDFV